MSSDIVAFSPVRQSAGIFELFLEYLTGEGVEVWLWDDGIPDDVDVTDVKVIGSSDIDPAGDYGVSDETHLWTGSAISRVAEIKNRAIDEFLATDARKLLLIDSDVVVQPGTVEHLDEADLPVVAAVYWSQWRPGQPWMPQVWDYDHYSFFSPRRVVQLRDPGHYTVGGLGACTLVDRAVLAAGVRFSPIPNLSISGEDRWFCIRAATAGFDLTACTHVTPYHVYRPTQLRAAIGWNMWFAEQWKLQNLDDEWAATIGGGR